MRIPGGVVQGLRLFMSRWEAALHRRMATGGVCCGKDLQKPQRRNQKPGPGALALLAGRGVSYTLQAGRGYLSALPTLDGMVSRPIRVLLPHSEQQGLWVLPNCAKPCIHDEGTIPTGEGKLTAFWAARLVGPASEGIQKKPSVSRPSSATLDSAR